MSIVSMQRGKGATAVIRTSYLSSSVSHEIFIILQNSQTYVAEEAAFYKNM